MALLNSSGACSLIVGGGGFLGKNLAELLLSEGQHVRIFERVGYDPGQFPSHHKIEWHFGDYSRAGDISPALANIDTVYLFSSTTTPKTSNDDYCHDIRSNLLATISFLDTASNCGVKKIIFPSSGGTVYGIPESTPILPSIPTAVWRTASPGRSAWEREA